MSAKKDILDQKLRKRMTMVFKKSDPLLLDKTLTSVSKEIAHDFMRIFEDEQNQDQEVKFMFPSPAYGKDLMDD